MNHFFQVRKTASNPTTAAIIVATAPIYAARISTGISPDLSCSFPTSGWMAREGEVGVSAGNNRATSDCAEGMGVLVGNNAAPVAVSTGTGVIVLAGSTVGVEGGVEGGVSAAVAVSTGADVGATNDNGATRPISRTNPALAIPIATVEFCEWEICKKEANRMLPSR